jgi:hypothetical protein
MDDDDKETWRLYHDKKLFASYPGMKGSLLEPLWFGRSMLALQARFIGRMGMIGMQMGSVLVR